MQREEAFEICEKYGALVDELRERVKEPENRFTARSWSLDDFYWSPGDGCFIAKWSMYIGCGDYEETYSYHHLSDLLKE